MKKLFAALVLFLSTLGIFAQDADQLSFSFFLNGGLEFYDVYESDAVQMIGDMGLGVEYQHIFDPGITLGCLLNGSLEGNVAGVKIYGKTIDISTSGWIIDMAPSIGWTWRKDSKITQLVLFPFILQRGEIKNATATYNDKEVDIDIDDGAYNRYKTGIRFCQEYLEHSVLGGWFLGMNAIWDGTDGNDGEKGFEMNFGVRITLDFQH